MARAQFEIFKDSRGRFRFRLRAPNSGIIASSETCQSRNPCKIGIASVRRDVSKATVQDLTR